MTKRVNRSKGPQFVGLFGPVLEALKELGGSGRPNEIIDLITSKLKISEELNEELPSGGTRFNKWVHWARFYLAKDGFIDTSQRGVWSLTEKGRSVSLTYNGALEIFHRVQDEIKKREILDSEREIGEHNGDEIGEDVPELGIPGHRAELLNILRNLSPAGFERFCQQLLREAGLDSVKVTGSSRDGGIDGQGILKINPFVSFRIVFQSKRYSEKTGLGSDKVRDFRGAIMGRADKGIFLTTGTFSAFARLEAIRDGAIPIELVDGEQLITMLEELEMGLVRKQTITIYEIDKEFFEKFE